MLNPNQALQYGLSPPVTYQDIFHCWVNTQYSSHLTRRLLKAIIPVTESRDCSEVRQVCCKGVVCC